jgi:hypothetical protein
MGSGDGCWTSRPQGLKPRESYELYAALKRRCSTVAQTSIAQSRKQSAVAQSSVAESYRAQTMRPVLI